LRRTRFFGSEGKVETHDARNAKVEEGNYSFKENILQMKSDSLLETEKRKNAPNLRSSATRGGVVNVMEGGKNTLLS